MGRRGRGGLLAPLGGVGTALLGLLAPLGAVGTALLGLLIPLGAVGPALLGLLIPLGGVGTALLGRLAPLGAVGAAGVGGSPLGRIAVAAPHLGGDRHPVPVDEEDDGLGQAPENHRKGGEEGLPAGGVVAVEVIEGKRHHHGKGQAKKAADAGKEIFPKGGGVPIIIDGIGQGSNEGQGGAAPEEAEEVQHEDGKLPGPAGAADARPLAEEAQQIVVGEGHPGQAGVGHPGVSGHAGKGYPLQDILHYGNGHNKQNDHHKNAEEGE